MVHGGAPHSLKVVASIIPMRGGCLSLKILVRLLYQKVSPFLFFWSVAPQFHLVHPPIIPCSSFLKLISQIFKNLP